tara:strand:+ start:778 stop:1203 length:426 start_codon:yes stop_codon:yes gene_type:complete
VKRHLAGIACALMIGVSACTITDYQSYPPDMLSVDRAIIAATENRGSLRLTLESGEQVMLYGPRRDGGDVCGEVYDRSNGAIVTEGEDVCFALDTLSEIQAYEERVSLQATLSGAALAVVLIPLYGLLLLGCSGGGSCGPN